MFEPGAYYVGDPVFILQSDDLRQILSEIVGPSGLVVGKKDLVVSAIAIIDGVIYEPYFVAKMQNVTGTLYDAQNNGWGFNFGVFGCVPWKWVENKESYVGNRIEFLDPFECAFTDDSVTIGHLHFTLNPQ